MIAKPRILSLFPTLFNKSIKREHACKILYVKFTLHFVQYGDQTYCENRDCVGRLEIDQAGCLLTHPRILH